MYTKILNFKKNYLCSSVFFCNLILLLFMNLIFHDCFQKRTMNYKKTVDDVFFEKTRNLWHIFSHKINCDIICIYVIYNMRTSFAICVFHMYLRCKAHVLKYETPAMISNKVTLRIQWIMIFNWTIEYQIIEWQNGFYVL